ncbi:phage recombination protein Bet [Adlercreutzia sp.]|uniref:phage recombination protein Bet n=1 Tax=Adlercreutzia sp. TaxID=1872387 RepID=UPI003AB63782
MSSSEIVQYKADNGQDITVTEQDVRDLMAANGNAMDNVTSQEVKTFLRLCQSQRLNPFIRDAYIVKYGNQPATVIAGKDAFVKRATRNKKYRGHEAGITVIGTDKKMHRREGSMLLTGETLVGGWAKVYLDGYECPIFEEVALSEYYAPDKYGKNGWSKMPATMIRKVALCHALREAFPEDLGGLYGAEEMDQARREEPQPSQQQEEELEVIVEDVPEEPQPSQQQEEDPRKPLWAEVAELKAQALALGTKEEGITSWLSANIKNPDGSPKQTKFFSAEEIIKLRDFLALNIANHEQLAAQEPKYVEEADYVEQDLADHDIPF